MELNGYWFYSDKLNLYGDRGNMIIFKERCRKRGIQFNIIEIKESTGVKISDADLLFIGGGSDREQAIATKDLMKIKSEFKAAVEDGVSALTICGGYQFLGSYYELLDGTKLKGLEILDFYTVAKPGRLIGNVVVESDGIGKIVGFENHGGRTYHQYPTLGKVIHGQGNNGEDGQEGLQYKNLIGTYLHGPILPKNPNIADFLIENAMKRKYGIDQLEPLDDQLENDAKHHVIKQLMNQK